MDDNGTFKLALFLMVFMTVMIFAIVFLIILPMKKIINRKRPNRIETVYRVLNMRDLEHGNASHPSGDTLACAYFLGCFFYIFDANWTIFIIVILCALGRVYVHCHWIGDTIVGGLLGMVMTYFVWADPYFATLAKPFLKLIVF